ncbi:MAG: glycosidase [Firmicutes bacterium]|nr:glycosidase [Bacillota bacterium]
MPFELQRLQHKPILVPRKGHPWEAAAVFNPAAIRRDGRIVLLYRASNRPFHAEQEPYLSAIGYAESEDGIHFRRYPQPVMVGVGEQEKRGVQDPRVSWIDGSYRMVYTAFGGHDGNDYRIATAVSDDLIHWREHRVLLDEPNKDGALLPDKWQGHYILYHRRPPHIWACWSDDLFHWQDHRIVLRTRENSWESSRIGIGPPPLRIPQGWLLIYHGVDAFNTYRLGAALLAADDPFRVIARQEQPILEPKLPWEQNGLIDQVVFSCGAVDDGQRWLIYYGAADTVIGVAAVQKSAVRFERETIALSSP